MTQISSRVERKRQRRKERNLKLSFWVAQTILAGIFFLSGVFKLLLTPETLAQSDPWIYQAPVWFVKLIGAIEMAAGAGIILPAMLQYKSVWSMRAAYGILVLLVLALVFHILREEWSILFQILVLAGLTSFVIWGRLKVEPIQDKMPLKR
jgi:putative oxidoreductase